MHKCAAGHGSLWIRNWKQARLAEQRGALKASSLWKWQSKATKGMWEQKRSVGGEKSNSCQLIVQRLLSLSFNEADTEISGSFGNLCHQQLWLKAAPFGTTYIIFIGVFLRKHHGNRDSPTLPDTIIEQCRTWTEEEDLSWRFRKVSLGSQWGGRIQDCDNAC